MLLRSDNTFLPEEYRNELWKSVSNLERQAVDKLSSRNDADKEDAIKLFAQSVKNKLSDPFFQLAQQYNSALEAGDQHEVDRIFSSLKLVGLPPHLQALARKKTGSHLLTSSVETVMEEVDPGSVFSDTVTDKVRVKIHTFYDPAKSEPDNGKYLFWYKVAIYNEGTEPVQVVARMWEIDKCRGEKEIVRGVGIIGTQPIIPPGELFSYKSACPLKVFPPAGKRLIGSMSGAYTLCKGNMGQHSFSVKVSKVNFILPDVL